MNSVFPLSCSDAHRRHGVTPDRDAYMLGWEKGVREYCVPSNGFSAGESGQPNNNVCPEDLREDFVQGYQRGRSIHLTRARVEALETKIEEGTARLQEVRKEIISTAAAQLNPLLTPSRRAELVAEVQGLNDEKNRLVGDLPRLRDELVTQERALDDLQQAMASSSFSIGN